MSSINVELEPKSPFCETITILPINTKYFVASFNSELIQIKNTENEEH